MIDIKDLQDFEVLLEQSSNILLINHIHMDPDAFGSLTAFFYILKKLGKNTLAVNDDFPPEDFNFLEAQDVFSSPDAIGDFQADLIISFDAASKERLGETFKNYEDLFENTPLVVLDHHMTNPRFGDINFVYPYVPSSCEIVFELVKALNLENLFDTKIATLLTAGIHTDTNIFYNQNTTPETLERAAELMRYGANFRQTIYEFFNKFSLPTLKLYARVGEKLQAHKNSKVYSAIITKKDFIDAQATKEDTAGIINKLSNLDGAEIVFIIYEFDGYNKVSLRSKNYDIGSLAASFENGGGHKNAAGFNSTKTASDLQEMIIKKIQL